MLVTLNLLDNRPTCNIASIENTQVSFLHIGTKPTLNYHIELILLNSLRNTNNPAAIILSWTTHCMFYWRCFYDSSILKQYVILLPVTVNIHFCV